MAGVVPKSTESGESAATKAYSLAAIAPTRFDKYTLIGKLGHGGMAEVNLAVVEGKGGFRKLVVIKRLHKHLAEEPGFVDMFLDEARLAARLNHPHVVQTHEVGEWEDNHFLAMEYLDGQGLERLLRISGQKGEPVPVDIAARIVHDALDGLAYAHELTDYDGTPLGVVHRDVSPQNIFITYNGVVKLLDFGIAKAATHIVETRTGVIKGKYAYIAPEQALAHEVDHRADLWSMGVVLWEVLTGRRLFKSVNELATLHETLQGEIKLPSAFRPEIPPELDTICMRALERDVNGRYQSAAEMKEDLESYLNSLPKTSGKQIAKLMRERFGEAIDAHKQTLAQCLKAGEIGMSVSHIQKLVESPMTTPTGMTPAPVTPTPTPSGAYAALSPPTGPQPAVQIEPAKKSSGMLWKIVLVFAVIGGAVAGALLIPFGGDERGDEPEQPVALSTSHPATSHPATSHPATSHPAEAAPVEGPTEVAADGVAQAQPIAPAVEEALEEALEPAVEEPGEPRSSDRRAARLRREREARRLAAQQPQTAQPPPPEPTQAASSDAPGYLTLATTPWTRVQLGGRDLGTTPIVRLELPPGTHTLQLTNPEQGINETYRVTIQSGQSVSRRLGLR